MSHMSATLTPSKGSSFTDRSAFQYTPALKDSSTSHYTTVQTTLSAQEILKKCSSHILNHNIFKEWNVQHGRNQFELRQQSQFSCTFSILNIEDFILYYTKVKPTYLFCFVAISLYWCFRFIINWIIKNNKDWELRNREKPC